METGLLIWLIVCGVVVIASFSVGANYLGDWKDAVGDEAYYSGKEASNYADSLRKAVAQKAICLPVWIVSFIITFMFIGLIMWKLW